MMHRSLVAIFLCFLVVSFYGQARAQEAETAPEGAPVVQEAPSGTNLTDEESPASDITEAVPTEEEVGVDFAEVLGYGGLVGYAIVALSIVGIALAGIFFFELRQGALVPGSLAQETEDSLRKGDSKTALDQSRASQTFLGHLLSSGLETLGDGRPEARNVMADASESWMNGVVRRIEYLNLIATVAPMLGLLGTVTGMVKTFAALSQATGPVDPVKLSAGIFQALVTTMMGLTVAIPILLLYTVLRNRADHVQAMGIATGEKVLAALPDDLASRRGSSDS